MTLETIQVTIIMVKEEVVAGNAATNGKGVRVAGSEEATWVVMEVLGEGASTRIDAHVIEVLTNKGAREEA